MKLPATVLANACARLLGLVLLATAASGCSDDGEAAVEDAPEKEARRTVLLYVAAQNSLGADGNWQRDSTEIMEGTAQLADGDCLLAFVDDGMKPRVYRFRKGKKPQVERLWEEDACSADPETLREVLQWTGQAFPAQEYGLVLWSHADGWLPPTNPQSSLCSFGIDVGPGGSMYADKTADGQDGAQMDIVQMAAAIRASGMHLRYVFFDACLMQSLETCYALRDVTDYVVASPIAISSNGAYYAHQVSAGLFSEDPADIARTYYADIADPALSSHYGDYGIVVAAVRTEGLEALARTTAELLPRSLLAGRTSPGMDGVQQYQSYSRNYFYRPHNYDAADAMRRLLPEEDYPRFLAALEQVVAYKAATPRFWAGPGFWAFYDVDQEHFCGVSMFIPQDVYTENGLLSKYGDLNEAFRRTEWYEAAGFAATGW